MKKTVLFMLLLGFAAIAFSQNISNLRLKDVDGKTFAVNEHLNNDATIILFWATWCLPCQKELPAVQHIVAKYANKKIRVLAISKDSPRSLSKVKAFVRRNKYPFTFLMDADGSVSADLLVDAIPHSFIANAKGDIVYSHTGYRKGDELDLEKALLQLWQK